MGDPEAGFLEVEEGLEGVEGVPAESGLGLVVNEDEVFGDGGVVADGRRRGEEADEVGAVAEVGGVVGDEIGEEGPGAGAEHEGEGEGENFGGADEGAGVVGEEAEGGVGVKAEGGGEGGFAGAGGRGEDDGVVGRGVSEGGGVEDGEPGAARAVVGEAGDFGEQEEAGLGSIGDGAEVQVIGKDTEGVGDVERDAGVVVFVVG